MNGSNKSINGNFSVKILAYLRFAKTIHMKTINTILFSILSVAALAQSSKYSRVKIFTGSEGLQQLAELGVAVDHGESKPETFFISEIGRAHV